MPEHDVSLSETELRAAKPNFHRGRLAPALESRGANLRPRKLDEKLSRDVARARRVALLAPRATLTQYRHPLGYVSAITKNFGKIQKLIPHFGRRELYSEWGRSPVGEVGDNNSHDRGQDFIPKGRRGFLTPPRDVQPILSVLERDERGGDLTIGDGAKMLRKFNNFAPSPIVKSRCSSSVGGGCNN